MKKRFKTRKRFKFKIIFYLFIIILSFNYSLKYIDNDNNIKSYIINNIYNYIKKDNNIINTMKDKLSSPTKIVYNTLNKSIEYDQLKSFKENKDIYFDYNNALSEYIYEDNKEEKKGAKKPLVYIYNTHQLEEYASSLESTLVPNVMLASYNLKDKLSKYGIKAVVENGNIKKYLNNHNMNYYESYDASRYYIIKAKKNYNNSFKYIIDLHRDSIKHNLSTIKYNNKKYARVLFVVGLGNSGYKSNLKLAKNLDKLFNKKVNGISRGYVKYKGDATNAVYNQDMHKNAFLIEVGGYQNTIEEVNNTLDILSEILYELLGE